MTTENCERCIRVDEHLHLTDDGQNVCLPCYEELGYEPEEILQEKVTD